MGLFAYKPEMHLDLEQMIEIVDKNMYSNKLKKKQTVKTISRGPADPIGEG